MFLNAIILSAICKVATGAQIPILPKPSSVYVRDPVDFDDHTPSYVFNALSGLLQQWSNALHPNGHSLVPCSIPSHTLLYHARKDAQSPPPSPEWLAFDVDMAYGIMGGPGEKWMSTYAVKSDRPLRCIYLDGMSAALPGTGTLDLQTAFMHLHVPNKTDDGYPPGHPPRGPRPPKGRPPREGPPKGRRPPRDGPPPGGPPGEMERARWFCDWFRNNSLTLDGVVRMNTGFELMYCDFGVGLDLVSHLNLTTAPFADEPPDDRRPPQNRIQAPSEVSQPPTPWPPSQQQQARDDRLWAWLQSAAWHYQAPGEARVHLSLAGMVTFYDPNITSLLAARRDHPEMVEHRLVGVAKGEAEWIRDRAVEAIRETAEGRGSGVNWQRLALGIKDRYLGRISALDLTLAKALQKGPNRTRVVEDVRTQTFMTMLPFIDLSPSKSRKEAERTARDRCRSSWTAMVPEGSLTREETVLFHAIDGVLTVICGTLSSIFSDARDALDDEKTVSHVAEAHTSRVVEWGDRIKKLKRWLGWVEWTRCEESCADDQICYVPQWPISMIARGQANGAAPTTPRCVGKEDLFPESDWD